MPEHSYLMILSLAFGGGMLHALDADHIVTITSLAGDKHNFRHSLQYCTRWALGHGSVLLFFGAAMFFLGMMIPVELSHFAEILVGVVLVLIGARIVIDIVRARAHLHFHQHDHLLPHAHWHQHHPVKVHVDASHQHQHKAVLIGMLHGVAGSAPLLALLPISRLHDPMSGMAYLLVFGIGTLASMLFFGGILGKSMSWLHCYSQRTIKATRLVIGLGAIVFGAIWIQVSI